MNDKSQPESQNYNDDAWLSDNVRPLVKQLHALCESRHIPFIAAFAYGLETKDDESSRERQFHMGGSCFIPADDRAPPEMHIAHSVLFEGLDASLPHIAEYAVKHALGICQSRTERQDRVPADATIN